MAVATLSIQRCFPTDELGPVLDSFERLLVGDLVLGAER